MTRRASIIISTTHSMIPNHLTTSFKSKWWRRCRNIYGPTSKSQRPFKEDALAVSTRKNKLLQIMSHLNSQTLSHNNSRKTKSRDRALKIMIRKIPTKAVVAEEPISKLIVKQAARVGQRNYFRTLLLRIKNLILIIISFQLPFCMLVYRQRKRSINP